MAATLLGAFLAAAAIVAAAAAAAIAAVKLQMASLALYECLLFHVTVTVSLMS